MPNAKQVNIPGTDVKVTSDPTTLVHMVAPTISLNIPKEGWDLVQANNTLGHAIEGIKVLQNAAERLKPVIGRILMEVKVRKLWKGHIQDGKLVYKNWTAYVEDTAQRNGYTRLALFEALRIAEKFPSLGEAGYARFGATRLLIAAANDVSEKSPNHLEVLESSLAGTVDDFKRSFKKSVVLAEGEEPTAAITIRVPESLKDRWNLLCEVTNLKGPELLLAMMEGYKLSKDARKRLAEKEAQAAQVTRIETAIADRKAGSEERVREPETVTA